MASLFDINENGEIVYDAGQSGARGSASLEQGESAADPEANVTESEVENGTDVVENIVEGTDLPDTLQGEEVLEETQEIEQIVSGGDTYNVSLLSDEVQAAVINALTPASGTLASGTIDYFDRVVSGLPSDYKYIGYRTSFDNGYDGVLYFGDDYEVENNIITFGEDTKELRVIRETVSGYNTITKYYETNIDGASIAYDLNGDVVYYTNAEVGYPVMGGYYQAFDYSPLIAVGLLCVMALAILQRIFLKR